MFTRLCLGLVVLIAIPAWSQVTSSTTETASNSDEDTRMQTPPPVSSEAYPTAVGSETRSNYLRAVIIFDTAYNDNVLGGGVTHPVSDVIYTIWPTIALDQTTPRQHLTLTYSPGFTFYQPTNELNNVNQSAVLAFQYRLSPHSAISVRNSFQRSSNILNQPDPLSGGSIAGSPQPTPAGVIAPFADQITNATNVDFSYQFSRNGMIGVGGVVTELDYPDPAAVPGLSNSSSRGGSAFFSHRLSGGQYIGATYQYLSSQANPVNAQSETQTHTIFPFYTIYLKRTVSLSLAGGPQLAEATQSSSPSYRSWTSAAMASIGWQRSHTNFAISYLRTTTGGGGLSGAFSSNSANASARWQLTRTWTIGSVASYTNNKNVTPFFSITSPGGHSISGTASIKHSISDHLRAELGYTRLHQSYNGIAAISSAPNSNREFFSLSYQFTRPLGR
jgi:hypothetical protein